MTATQKHLFDDSEPACDIVLPCDPNVLHSDVRRLTGQNAAVLERLQVGAATNRELCKLSLNYRARISDLRRFGYKIACERVNDGSGVSYYRLAKDNEA